MKKEANLLILIAFLIIFNMCHISALTNYKQDTQDTQNTPIINFSYPSTINSGEDFKVNLSLDNFNEDIYDIKIDFSTNFDKVSKIWNGETWQSTFNYVNDAINTQINNEIILNLNLTSEYNQSTEITVKIRDSKGKTFSFTGYSTKIISHGTDNSHENSNNQSNSNTITNSTNGTNNSPQNPVKNDISLKLDWNSDDIKNGDEFDIEINAINLEDKNYDTKVYIYEEDKSKPISQVYYNDKWISSTSYMNEFFSGPGDSSETARLRINKNFLNFSGDAKIGIRIREHGSKSYKEEYEDTIEILRGNNTSITSNKVKNSTSNNSTKTANTNTNTTNKINENAKPISEEIIHLGSLNYKSEDIKGSKNIIVYQSNNEVIKKYSLYIFMFLIIIFFVTFVFLKFNKKVKYNAE